MSASILVVDDEALVRRSIGEILGDAGYNVVEAADGEECLAQLARRPFDVVIIDIQLPGIDGLETFRRMARQHYCAETIVISAHGTIETAVEAMRYGAHDFLEKPFSSQRLRTAVDAAVRAARHRHEIEVLRSGGWVMGDFFIEREIGVGAAATIYKARQRGLDRTVALKVLHPHLTVGDSFRARFQREAKVLAAMDHPNIVRLYDAGEVAKRYYLALEYLAGTSVGTFLQKSTCLPLSLCLLIGIEVCRGLTHAHERGVIHRDLKPHNIIITAEGEVKMVDFGLAAWLHDPSGCRLTDHGYVVGTPHFMAPEQIESKSAGPASDIFSLGVALYLMTTLRFPFPGENLPAVLHAIVKGTCCEPRRFNRLMTQEESDIIMQCLSSDPAQRFASARQLELRLQEAVEARGIGIKELKTMLREYAQRGDIVSEANASRICV